jgi:hypothetical protein
MPLRVQMTLDPTPPPTKNIQINVKLAYFCCLQGQIFIKCNKILWVKQSQS